MTQNRNLTNKLGENIRKLREKRGLTLQQVSDKIGISVSYLNRLEQQKRNPSLPVLIKIAEVFDITVDFLLFGYDREKDKAIKHISQDIGLSSKEAEILEEIINFIVLLDWSNEEERFEKVVFDLSLKIDKFKRVNPE